MKERAIRVGRPMPLIGVICEPDKIDNKRPAVLIFNSGVMHHIGSCRLSVKLARSFADVGVLSVRFDFSGIGDSGARRGVKSFNETGPIEAAEIMNYLQEKRGIKTFILYGLCSGADAAFDTALADNRVVAYSQIDAYCYKTALFYFHYYKSKVFQLERWFNFSKRMIKKIIIRKDNQLGVKENTYLEAASYIRVFPHKKVVESGLKTLIDRGVYLNILFTGSEDNYAYKKQYRDSFKRIDFGSFLELHYLNRATHIITHPEHQILVVHTITDWLMFVISKTQQRP